MQVSAPLPQASHVHVERAGVWDVRTRGLVWAPEGANALAWLPAGDRIIGVGESYKPPADARQRITRTPYQSDFSHHGHLHEWPSRRLLASCELEFPTGWLIDIVPSPAGDVAAYVWLDQTEAGFEFLAIGGDSLSHLEAGYFGENSNLIAGPVFSPDGTYAVASYGGGVWWSEDRNEPSPGGELLAGTIVIANPMAQTFEERDVLCNVERGWLPDNPEGIHAEMLSPPTFISDRAFTVTAANGQTIAFDITA